MDPLSMPSPEVELKFQVSPDTIAAVLADPIFKHKTKQYQLRSIYYDTPNCDLRKCGLSLRVRVEDGVFLQTVKRQAVSGLFDRDEWESAIHGEAPERSAWARTPIADVLTHKRMEMLAPVFTTQVIRLVHLLRASGSLIEVSLDRGEVVAGAMREPIDEVELELKRGDAACLFDAARRLPIRAGLWLSLESKAERGYRLVEHESELARKAEPTEIASDMRAIDAFAAVARSCIAQISANAQLLRATKNAEVIHQLRIGLRRLRAALAAFRPILPTAGVDGLKHEISWFSTELNSAREIDVFIEKTRETRAAIDCTTLADFDEHLLRARDIAYSRALSAVNSNRFSTFLLTCAECAPTARSSEQDTPKRAALCNATVVALASESLTRFRSALLKSSKHFASLEPAKRHKARIAAKKLRYAGEFFASMFGKHRRKRRSLFLASLSGLLSALGDLNDTAAARRTACLIAGRSPQMAFLAGRLIGARDKDEPKLLAKAIRIHKRWRNAKPFWP